jgi:hypothetical protein
MANVEPKTKPGKPQTMTMDTFKVRAYLAHYAANRMLSVPETLISDETRDWVLHRSSPTTESVSGPGKRDPMWPPCPTKDFDAPGFVEGDLKKIIEYKFERVVEIDS